eukprot:jgi/Chrzof1/14855/Cz09g18170.t1
MPPLSATMELKNLTVGIGEQLDSLCKQMQRLQACSALVTEQGSRVVTSRGVQAELGPHSHPLQHITGRSQRAHFQFQEPSRQINWKRIRGVNVDQMVNMADTAVIMDFFEDVAYGDILGESVFNLSEANLIKVIRLAQLQLQYLQHKLEEKADAQQALEDESLALTAGLTGMPDLSLSDLKSGIGQLHVHVKQLGETQVDAIIGQVRAEERSAVNSSNASQPVQHQRTGTERE